MIKFFYSILAVYMIMFLDEIYFLLTFDAIYN